MMENTNYSGTPVGSPTAAPEVSAASIRNDPRQHAMATVLQRLQVGHYSVVDVVGVIERYAEEARREADQAARKETRDYYEAKIADLFAQRTAGEDAERIQRLAELHFYAPDAATMDIRLHRFAMALLGSQPVAEAAAQADGELTGHSVPGWVARPETDAERRLRELYEAVSMVVAEEKALNITRLHDYLGGEEGMSAEAMLCDIEPDQEAQPALLDDERAAFEAWARTWTGQPYTWDRRDDGYWCKDLDDDWIVWQARAALRQLDAAGHAGPCAAIPADGQELPAQSTRRKPAMLCTRCGTAKKIGADSCVACANRSFSTRWLYAAKQAGKEPS